MSKNPLLLFVFKDYTSRKYFKMQMVLELTSLIETESISKKRYISKTKDCFSSGWS